MPDSFFCCCKEHLSFVKIYLLQLLKKMCSPNKLLQWGISLRSPGGLWFNSNIWMCVCTYTYTANRIEALYHYKFFNTAKNNKTLGIWKPNTVKQTGVIHMQIVDKNSNAEICFLIPEVHIPPLFQLIVHDKFKCKWCFWYVTREGTDLTSCLQSRACRHGDIFLQT